MICMSHNKVLYVDVAIIYMYIALPMLSLRNIYINLKKTNANAHYVYMKYDILQYMH
jgi:hypothetical protein